MFPLKGKSKTGENSFLVSFIKGYSWLWTQALLH